MGWGCFTLKVGGIRSQIFIFKVEAQVRSARGAVSPWLVHPGSLGPWRGSLFSITFQHLLRCEQPHPAQGLSMLLRAAALCALTQAVFSVQGDCGHPVSDRRAPHISRSLLAGVPSLAEQGSGSECHSHLANASSVNL